MITAPTKRLIDDHQYIPLPGDEGEEEEQVKVNLHKGGGDDKMAKLLASPKKVGEFCSCRDNESIRL
jgi:hypothetical protein